MKKASRKRNRARTVLPPKDKFPETQKLLKNRGISVEYAAQQLGGDNQGAVAACKQIAEVSIRLDPEAPGGELHPLYLLDRYRIYKERLYILWHNVCLEDPVRMIILLRAYELGELADVNRDLITRAISAGASKIDFQEVLKAVKRELPEFDRGVI